MVKGSVHGDKRFDINLSSGPSAKDATPGDDIPLHVSVRLAEHQIVLNSLANGHWGAEEIRTKHKFKNNEDFEFRIRINDGSFGVFLNGTEIGTYPFRQPLEKVKHICIWGDLKLEKISWENRYKALPFKANASSGFGPGKKVDIIGVVNEEAKRFEVNLVTGNGVALHFNPRFDEKKVVRNVKNAGAWGSNEEREGAVFPFSKGKIFDLSIRSEPDGYYIFVDGMPFCNFQHRIAPDEVNAVLIDGDIGLLSCNLH